MANHRGETAEDPFAIYRYLGTPILDAETGITFDRLMTLDHRFKEEHGGSGTGLRWLESPRRC